MASLSTNIAVLDAINDAAQADTSDALDIAAPPSEASAIPEFEPGVSLRDQRDGISFEVLLIGAIVAASYLLAAMEIFG